MLTVLCRVGGPEGGQEQGIGRRERLEFRRGEDWSAESDAIR